MGQIREYKAGYKIKRNIKKGSGVIKRGRIFERKKYILRKIIKSSIYKMKEKIIVFPDFKKEKKINFFPNFEKILLH